MGVYSYFFMVVYSLRTSVEWERTNHPGEYPGIQRHHSRYRYRVDSSVDQDTKTSRVGFSSAHFKLLNIKKIVWFIILFRSAGKRCETSEPEYPKVRISHKYIK